ncbi:glycosyl hydrolase family 43 [Phlyctema vagabunda]|uniref:Glycosyl hydrolase family 43 n=1 Tax=Phlyctema vagabunda TaxID=108571 RepID=A0ABR4PRP9_9HELO
MFSHILLAALWSLSLMIHRTSATAGSEITTTLTNGNHYIFDTNGNAIDSTSGKIDFFNGTYVWYGLSFACGGDFCGILSYSSSDLATWTHNGWLFDPSTPEIEALCSGELTGNCGRPHIVYDEGTQEYVLWVNALMPGYAIFTSSSPTSGYTFLEERALVGVQPEGTMAGDFTVEVVNGTGYVVYSLIDFATTGSSIWPPFLQDFYVQELTSDLRNTTGEAYKILPVGDLVDQEAESPDIFQRGDWFYISASNTCGFCTGTLLIMYRSKSIQGPWQRQIISADTCNGQTTGVLALPSPTEGGPTTYIHQADTFSDAPPEVIGIRTGIHGHEFQKLEFNTDGSVQDIDCTAGKQTTISFAEANAVPQEHQGRAVSATDGSGQSGNYSVVCDLPQYQLYQTWASSKSGSLTEVGVNMAAAGPTGNLTVTVFRYGNNTDFFTPRYVWESLATVNIVPADLSDSMRVVRVLVNATVQEGDRLGLALVNDGVTPMCHPVLSHDNTVFNETTSTRTLFANGPGQVSLRGKLGNRPPVNVLPGKEIKWYSIVE